MKQLLRIGFLPTLLVIGAIGVNSCKDDKATGTADPKTAAAGGGDKIGVVDLEQVGKDLGWAKELDANMAKFQKQLEDEFKQVTAVYELQLQQKKKEYGILDTDTMAEMNKKLTPQQQQELGVMFENGRRILGQLQQAANQQVVNYRSEWGKQYREALTPLVKQVAWEKRLAIVIGQPGPLLYTDPTVDITPAVVDAAKSKPPTFKEIPVPKIQVPQYIGTTQPTTQSATQPDGVPASKP